MAKKASGRRIFLSVRLMYYVTGTADLELRVLL